MTDGARDRPTITTVTVLGAAHIHLSDVAELLQSYPAVRVAAVWDHDLRRAERWAAVLGARAGTDLEAALAAEDLEGVLVYGETSRHPELVKAVVGADASLAVFVEKPLAALPGDAVAVAQALGQADHRFSTGLFLRYASAFVRLRELVGRGEAGSVHRARVVVVHGGLAAGWFDGEYRWLGATTEGGGGFFDLGIHGLDLVSWVLGPVAAIVEVDLSPTGHHGHALLRTVSGVLVDLEAGWEAPGPLIEMTVFGSVATLTASGGGLTSTAAVSAVVSGSPPAAADAPRAWLDALVGIPAPPLVPLADAVEGVELIARLRREAGRRPAD